MKHINFVLTLGGSLLLLAFGQPQALAFNQKWTLTHLGNGQYQAVGIGSGKLSEVAGASTAKGANVQIFTSNNNNCQKWTVTPTGDGNYKFMNVNSGSTADYNQQWRISLAP